MTDHYVPVRPVKRTYSDAFAIEPWQGAGDLAICLCKSMARCWTCIQSTFVELLHVCFAYSNNIKCRVKRNAHR